MTENRPQKGDIDFDECQMRAAGNGSNFTRTNGCIKAWCVSGFNQCSFGKCFIRFICPCVPFYRQGRLLMAVVAKQSSIMADRCDSNVDCSC